MDAWLHWGHAELVLENTAILLHQQHWRQEYCRTKLILAERATTPPHQSETICHLLQLIHNETADYTVQVLEKVSSIKQTQSLQNQPILVLDLRRPGCNQVVREFCLRVENLCFRFYGHKQQIFQLRSPRSSPLERLYTKFPSLSLKERRK